MEQRALVIAIADYHHVARLPKAVSNDALQMQGILISKELCGFPPQNVTMLLDEDATLAKVEEALDDLAAKSGKEDTVLVYFSGHGARYELDNAERFGLLPVDATTDDLDGTILTQERLSNYISRIKSDRVIVLIDACHAAGAVVLKSLNSEILGVDEKNLRLLTQGRGRVVIASSRADQTSLVRRGDENSLFTGYLCDALKGSAGSDGNGKIRVFQTFTYVQECLQKGSRGQQRAVFMVRELEDNFPLSLFKGGLKEARAASGVHPREKTAPLFLVIRAEIERHYFDVPIAKLIELARVNPTIAFIDGLDLLHTRLLQTLSLAGQLGARHLSLADAVSELLPLGLDLETQKLASDLSETRTDLSVVGAVETSDLELLVERTLKGLEDIRRIWQRFEHTIVNRSDEPLYQDFEGKEPIENVRGIELLTIAPSGVTRIQRFPVTRLDYKAGRLVGWNWTPVGECEKAFIRNSGTGSPEFAWEHSWQFIGPQIDEVGRSHLGS